MLRRLFTTQVGLDRITRNVEVMGGKPCLRGLASRGDRSSSPRRMRILIGMNLSPLWVRFFAEAGFESLHWSSIGEPSAPDTQIMDYAIANKMIVFTHDLDFGALFGEPWTWTVTGFGFCLF